jgi:hypothetical protein
MNEIFVCPMPDTWNKIFIDLLNAWKQNPRGKGPPPTPLILTGWNFSGDFEKNAVWEATNQWANEMDLSHLIPELTDEQSYFVSTMQSYSCRSEFWNYSPREKPAKGEIDIAIKKLKDNWGSIVGPELAEITAPECFTGKKSRRLLVSANFATNPPWGTWSKKSAGEKGKAFTMFRRDINEAISPMEIDHIDFIDSKSFKEEN